MATGGQPPGSLQASPQSNQPDTETLRKRIKQWYPGWKEKTLYIPPVLMNHTQHKTHEISGVTVCVPEAPVESQPSGKTPKRPKRLHKSDVISDCAQQQIRHCFCGLEKEQKNVMTVIFDLKFEDYLRKTNFAAATIKLPKPVDLKPLKQDRGDFDILIIHRFYGILACEIKSVGAAFPSVLTKQQKLDVINDKVTKAVKQLDKCGDVVTHLVSDMPRKPRILKTLMLPNVSTSQLKDILESDKKLLQKLRLCLGEEDPISVCVTTGHLTDPMRPHYVTDNVIQQFGTWWEARMLRKGTDPAMSDDVYLELLARFVGPATIVRVFCSTDPALALDTVRTEGEGASETGKRFTSLVLTPHQHAIRSKCAGPLVLFTGPPGVGKSLMLLLEALQWLKENKHVEILSTWPASLAASHHIHHQLQQTTQRAARQRIHLHEFDLKDEEEQEKAVTTLMTSANKHKGELYVIVDEMCYGSGRPPFENLIHKLRGQLPKLQCLHMWVACMRMIETSQVLTEIPLKQPLRTPPSVTREVQKSKRMGTKQYNYEDLGTPYPTDGPPVVYLSHAGLGHCDDPENNPQNCVECGRGLAALLKNFHVGAQVPDRSSPPLEYKDVFVLTAKPVFDTDGLVVGLRQEGLPVTVFLSEDSKAAANVATMATNKVVVADYKDVHGLERKVVVWVQNYVTSHAGKQQVEDEGYGRMYAMSRSSAQLVCVVPKSPPQNC